MKFCDKLTMQRKKNNMSQELLADRLGVSRQAVSKWESGTSIPDMERIMELCKVLNCNLDDLMDDGVMGDRPKEKEKNNSNIINTYLKEGLGFVTKSLNMFWSMRFRDKVKCIIELVFISLVIYLLWSGIYYVLSSIFGGLLYLLPELLYKIIHNVFKVIYSILGLAVGVILVIHVFKIRYLDYFVTVEDSNAKSKSIETPVDEEEKKEDDERKFIEKKKNKIIIRDPKHSTYTFFDFLAGVAIFIIKFILIFISLAGIFSFIFLAFCLTFAAIKMFSSMFFMGVAISLLGMLLVNYICLKIIFTFIFNQKQKFKRAFIIFISGLLLFGIGFGISFTTYLSFDEVTLGDIEYKVVAEEIDMNNDTSLAFLDDDKAEIVIDDSIDNIKIETTYDNNGYIDFRSHRVYSFEDGNQTYYEVWACYYYNSENGFIGNFNYLLDKIKNKERIDGSYNGIYKYKITVSSSNLEILKNNYKNLSYY